MKYTAVVSYKVIATVNVEADNFREAVSKIRRKWHSGEMGFTVFAPEEKTFNILGLSESEWAEKLVENENVNEDLNFDIVLDFLNKINTTFGPDLSKKQFLEVQHDIHENFTDSNVVNWIENLFQLEYVNGKPRYFYKPGSYEKLEQSWYALEKPGDDNWQPTFENLRSFLSDNEIHIGTVIPHERYHKLITDAREWAGYPLGQWLMDCFSPYDYDHIKYSGEISSYIFDPVSWESLEKEWHERWP